VGSFLGAISVAFGAYSEHSLKPVITEEQFRFLITAIRYNQIHAIIIIITAIVHINNSEQSRKIMKWVGRTFITGTICFSFSIYLSVLTGINEITYLTPVGGLTLIFAWILLGIAGIQLKKVNSAESK
tara:strand:- start:1450 stop:1833 length:384 start_codon:yes stop_codon:yes gene_type:complete